LKETKSQLIIKYHLISAIQKKVIFKGVLMPQARTLTKSQIKQVVEVIKSCSRYPLRDVSMLMMTHLCGLRIGEVATLKIDGVMDASGKVLDEITLSAQITKNNEARKVMLPRKMQRHLQEHINEMSRIPSHGYLFSTQKQNHFTPNTAAQHLKRLYQRAGITGATSHSGRRTWLTTLSEKGVSVFVLAEMAGHKDLRQTARYITVNDAIKRNAAELI